MDLIIGGAYQGKLDHAKKKYALTEEQIYTCSEEGPIAFGARCIYDIQEYTLWCVHNEEDAAAVFRAHRDEWKDAVLICEDIFCGVVPIEPEARAWREKAGRVMAAIAANSNTVTRLFCGIPKRLK